MLTNLFFFVLGVIVAVLSPPVYDFAKNQITKFRER